VEPHRIFSALGDQTRLEVLSSLANHGPATATQLAGMLPVSRQAVAKHLAALDAVGLVSRESAGREVRYSFQADPIDRVATWARETGDTWDRRLDRLRESFD
jgi:DNA-binding transcriptional ArsR family regulator